MKFPEDGANLGLNARVLLRIDWTPTRYYGIKTDNQATNPKPEIFVDVVVPIKLNATVIM